MLLYLVVVLGYLESVRILLRYGVNILVENKGYWLGS